jgi:hypothetical protein
MAYIGKTPTIGNFQVCDAISVVNGQAAYTMQVGGVNVSPESSQHMLVSLNGVIQKNGGTNPSFTVSGSTITFASNLVTGDVIDFIQILGNVLDLGVPSDATVSTAKIVDANVTAAKMFSGFANGITNSQQWRISAAQTGMNTGDPITNNWEVVDSYGYAGIGSAMTQSSGIFTFPSTGIWHISFTYNGSDGTAQNYIGGQITPTTDNSTYNIAVQGNNNIGAGQYFTGTINFIFDVTNTTTHKIRFAVHCATNGIQVGGNTNRTDTGAVFTRLGDT